MEIDDQDRILVTECRANKVALFDTKTEQFTEYDLPQVTFPYRAEIDKNGELWTGGMSSHSVVRLDPKVGQGSRISDAERHQHAYGVRGQLDHPGDILGRQQPRPCAGEGRAAGLRAGACPRG